MNYYRIAPGHNVAFGSLAIINPQPQSPGVEVGRRLLSGNNKIYQDMRHLWLIWSSLQDAAMYQGILAQGDLDTATLIMPVTVYARNHVWAWHRYNGWAEQPRVGESIAWQNYYIEGVGVIIKELAELED